MASMEIIDSHVHFWDPGKLGYEWHQDVPKIAKAHLPKDFTAATDGIDISGIVFVEADCQAGQKLGEVEWVDSLAQQDSRILGVVAAAAVDQGSAEVESQLKALREHALVRGVRHLIQDREPGFATRPSFIEGIQMLPSYGFSFDLCLKHAQLPEVIQLVESCPETDFVLDHIAKPGIADGTLDPWRRHIDALASLPQVVACKLSGLITEAKWTEWTTETLQPYVEHVVQAFGPDRLLYGSDWPVSVLAGGYQAWWISLYEILDALLVPPLDQEKIYGTNARRVYRLAAN